MYYSIDCIVIIPVYKPIATKAEQASFIQCLKVLSKYQICLISYETFDCNWYLRAAQEHGKSLQLIAFDKTFFVSLDGYNRLMMSYCFYKSFRKYKYILIYQLDAWVFYDALEVWCRKGFDYVGAPWFTDNGSYEDGNFLWAVGNGGISLRKTKTFMDLFEKNRYDFSLLTVIKRKIKGQKTERKRFKTLIGEWQDAEDIFYCLRLKGTQLELKVPSIEEGMGFAFERSPRYLYSRLGHLPFGCHAWERYDKEFWSEFIKISSF